MLHPAIQRRPSLIKGDGLFAVRPIVKGEKVWQLDPRRDIFYTPAQAMALSDELKALIFQYKDRYVLNYDDTRYMNHSCDPNTWWASDSRLVARRGISRGEEITYDYATSDCNDDLNMICNCGSKNCRKIIIGNDWKIKEIQERYKGLFQKNIQDKIDSGKTV